MYLRLGCGTDKPVSARKYRYTPQVDFSLDPRLSFAGETFSRLQLVGAQVAGRAFEKCTFEKCRMVQCSFEQCKFVDCIFAESLLSAVSFRGCSFLETSLRDTKVIGLDWRQAARIRNLQCIDCDVSQSLFGGMKLPNLVLRNCIATEADFGEADYTDADFDGTDFDGGIFHRTNLTGAI